MIRAGWRLRGAWVALLLLASGISAGRSDAAAIEAREVSFQSAGLRLVGTLTRPSGAAARAGVLIISGSGSVDRDGTLRAAPSIPPVYRQWAERLAEAGFAVLRYDKRFLTHPGIDIPSFDEEAQLADALAAVSFLRAMPEMASKPIFLIGHSEGGTLAPIVAERAGSIAGVVVVNTVLFPVDELLVEQLRANPSIGGDAVEGVKRLLGSIKDGSFPEGGLLLGAGAEYWAQWIRFSTSAADTLASASTPLLIVHCLSDQTLPGPTLARNLAISRQVTGRNPKAQRRELAGHDHFAMRPGERESSSEFLAAVIGWLETAGRGGPR